jgi:hypothetical protein
LQEVAALTTKDKKTIEVTIVAKKETLPKTGV